MATKHDVLQALQHHIGKEKAISGEDLARFCSTNGRRLRHITDELIDDGIALCSHPAHGYWIAADAAELQGTVDFHHGRAMHELKKVSKLSKIPLPDLLGQLHLRT